jgi:hypothetical protein
LWDRNGTARGYGYLKLRIVISVAVVVGAGKVESGGETARDAGLRVVRVLEKRVRGKSKRRKAGWKGGVAGRDLHDMNSGGDLGCGKQMR